MCLQEHTDDERLLRVHMERTGEQIRRRGCRNGFGGNKREQGGIHGGVPTDTTLCEVDKIELKFRLVCGIIGNEKHR